MAQVLVRDLDDKTVQRLKEMAQRHRRSLNQEVRAILEAAVAGATTDSAALAEKIRTALASRGVACSDSGHSQAEDRSR